MAMPKVLMLAVLLVLSLATALPTRSALAFSIDLPSVLLVNDSDASLNVQLRDINSNEAPEVQLLGPARYSAQIQGTNLQLTVFNAEELYATTYATTLSVKIGNEIRTKILFIEFQKPQATPEIPEPVTPPDQNQPSDTNAPSDQNTNNGMDLNTLFPPALVSFANENWETALQALLVFIVVLLAIGLLARIYHRIKGEKKI